MHLHCNFPMIGLCSYYLHCNFPITGLHLHCNFPMIRPSTRALLGKFSLVTSEGNTSFHSNKKKVRVSMSVE